MATNRVMMRVTPPDLSSAKSISLSFDESAEEVRTEEAALQCVTQLSRTRLGDTNRITVGPITAMITGVRIRFGILRLSTTRVVASPRGPIVTVCQVRAAYRRLSEAVPSTAKVPVFP